MDFTTTAKENPMTTDHRARFMRRVDEMSDRELRSMLRRFRADPSPQTEKIDLMAQALRERKGTAR